MRISARLCNPVMEVYVELVHMVATLVDAQLVGLDKIAVSMLMNAVLLPVVECQYVIMEPLVQTHKGHSTVAVFLDIQV